MLVVAQSLLGAVSLAPPATAVPACVAQPGAYDEVLCDAPTGFFDAFCLAAPVAIVDSASLSNQWLPGHSVAVAWAGAQSSQHQASVARVDVPLPASSVVIEVEGIHAECSASTSSTIHDSMGTAQLSKFRIWCLPVAPCGATFIEDAEAFQWIRTNSMNVDVVRTQRCTAHASVASVPCPVAPNTGGCTSPCVVEVRLNEQWGPVTPAGSTMRYYGMAAAHVHVSDGSTHADVYLGVVVSAVKLF